jgi:hypothetical protein
MDSGRTVLNAEISEAQKFAEKIFFNKETRKTGIENCIKPLLLRILVYNNNLKQKSI